MWEPPKMFGLSRRNGSAPTATDLAIDRIATDVTGLVETTRQHGETLKAQDSTLQVLIDEKDGRDTERLAREARDLQIAAELKVADQKRAADLQRAARITNARLDLFLSGMLAVIVGLVGTLISMQAGPDHATVARTTILLVACILVVATVGFLRTRRDP